MSGDHGHGGPPPGEAPRWLDHPANLKKLTRVFFGFAALVFLADVVFFFAHKHHAFGGEHGEPEGLQVVEGWFGFYSIFGFAGIVLLVVGAVGLRKLVMQPEDFYSRDYPETQDGDKDEDGGAHHG